MELMTAKEITGLSESFNREEYNSPEIFKREMQKIYGTNWCFAGISEELNKVGDRLVVDIGDESILILRNRENQLRAFYNVANTAVHNFVTQAVLVMARRLHARITPGAIRLTALSSRPHCMKKTRSTVQRLA